MTATSTTALGLALCLALALPATAKSAGKREDPYDPPALAGPQAAPPRVEPRKVRDDMLQCCTEEMRLRRDQDQLLKKIEQMTRTEDAYRREIDRLQRLVGKKDKKK